MTGRYGNLDYPTLTKFGFGLGVALFVAGLVGETMSPAVFGTIPAWEHTVFFDAEAVGVAFILLSPFVFGILLPLTE